ncbi:MAG: 50S ribosomal protein L10 [Magnetococcales bacterium]|nr:50S ribosomal protein L10 [Magnetococcales bacterium]
MNQTEKGQVIAQIREKLQRSNVAIVAHYRGLTVAEMTELRRKSRDAGVEYQVIKNTLARLATKETGFVSLTQFLSGPTSLATSADAVAPAKVLMEFVKTHPKMQIVGGVLNGSTIDMAAITALSALPSREALLAQLLGTLQAPIQGMVGVLAAVPGGFVRVLEQIRQQKESPAADVAG